MVKQMNNIIKNKKEEVSKGIELNDKDYLNSINVHLNIIEY